MTFTPDPAVEAEICRLEALPLAELKAVWKERHGIVPKHQSADLLRRRLAYELQVRAYGGLSHEIRRRIAKLHKAFAADPNYTPQINQRLKPRTILTREWKSVVHQVNILEEGFNYAGEHFQSLSKIAERITGTKWSGPAFFGLRKAPR